MANPATVQTSIGGICEDFKAKVFPFAEENILTILMFFSRIANTKKLIIVNKTPKLRIFLISLNG